MDRSVETIIAPFWGQQVVLDTQGPLIYIGTLVEMGRDYFVLAEADVHDRNDSPASKELYLVETVEVGVHVNRERVVVMREVVASVSLLSEVRE